MIDIRTIRDQPEKIADKLSARFIKGQAMVDQILSLDNEHRTLLRECEALRRQRNGITQTIARAKAASDNASALIEQMRLLREQLMKVERRLDVVAEQLRAKLDGLPNLPHDTVPVSERKDDKKIVRTYGEPPQQTFPVQNHIEIGARLGLFDFERGAKIAGSRFPLYLGLGAQLEMALINFMLDVNVREKKYKHVIPPMLVNAATMFAAGNLPKFGDQLYHCTIDDFYALPTAESPLTAIHRDEILDERELPMRYTAYTPCFRREAGAAGAHDRGLIRMHQFNKVELYKLTTPDSSYAELESLVLDVEDLLRRLKIHYRTTLLTSGDIGQAAAKTYDVEVWLPAQKAYYEVSSCSNCEQYQARRANIRYVDKQDGTTRFVHTLNGSGLATSRLMVALLENNQRADGSVTIPEVLRPYLGSSCSVISV